MCHVATRDDGYGARAAVGDLLGTARRAGRDAGVNVGVVTQPLPGIDHKLGQQFGLAAAHLDRDLALLAGGRTPDGL